MNEITRIHLAKIAYNIEPSAKKELSKYIDALQASLNDDEVMADIEIRMTELLRERSVKPEGTIDSKDVAALKKQLGEPSDFMEDTAETEPTTEPAERKTGERKLFRDPRGAWFGGVLNGLATLSGVPVWALRVILVLVALLSHGIILAVYLAFWLIMPRAKTPADILQLEGKPVTAQAIQRIGMVPAGHDGWYLKATRMVGGSVAVFLALAAAGGTAFLAYKYNSPQNYFGFRSLRSAAGYDLSYWHWSLAGFIVSGLFAAVTFSALAYMLFGAKIRRRTVILAVVAAVFAVSSLGASFVLERVQQHRYDAYIRKHTITRTIPLSPASFSAIASDTDVGEITYRVSDGNPRIVYTYTDLSRHYVTPRYKLDGDTLSVQYSYKQAEDFDGVRSVTVYGPALSSVNVRTGGLTYTSGGQPSLGVTVAPNASLSLAGSIGTVEGSIGSHGMLYASAGQGRNSTTAKLDLAGNAQANFDVVENLSVKLPDSCSTKANIYIGSLVTSQAMLNVNGKTVPMGNYEATCGSIVVNG